MPTPSVKRAPAKKAVPTAASRVSHSSRRRPTFFVPMVSAIAIVFAFIAVLLAFNTVTGTFLQSGTNQRVDDLQMQVDALRERMLMQQSTSPSGVVLYPVQATSSAAGTASSTASSTR